MNPLLVLVLLTIALSATPSAAQSQQPYAGLEGRSIKALSEQQIADLKEELRKLAVVGGKILQVVEIEVAKPRDVAHSQNWNS